MGIQGLLPQLKSIMVPIHIKDLEGCTVAVDTYSWLHKGALSCSRELCKGMPTSRVNLLRHYGVRPILVFDGGLLPMKIEQENKRERARKQNLARAIEHESNGNSTTAYECYQKAVDISPAIAHGLIQVLRRENISFVVAPYEADAQMTFLAVSKQVDAVITEDSDLIPFGCHRIIFKMDKFGQGVEFKQSMLQHNKELNFAGFTKLMLLEMCILSGCDYLQSLPGMGLKRAHALIRKYRSFEKVIKHLRYNGVSVPPLYEEAFKKAILTFLHQRVFDPITGDIVHLAVMSDVLPGDLDFLGPPIPQEVAKGIANGDLDPFTKQPFEQVESMDHQLLKRTSQLDNHKSERKKLDLPVQKNPLTKYFCFASLEAKRNFRAPRISPKHPGALDDSVSSPDGHGTMEVPGQLNSSRGFLAESKNTVPSPRNLEEDGFQAEDMEVSDFAKNVGTNATEGSPERILLQPSNQSVYRPCVTLHTHQSCKNGTDAIDGKSKAQNKKVTVRSRYFQQKSVKEDDQENELEKILIQNDVAADTCVKMHHHLSRGNMKRKESPSDEILAENASHKLMRASAVCSNHDMHQSEEHLVDAVQKEKNSDDHVSIFDNATIEAKTEEKFGSNISHLGHYSEIAEKSLEKFASVVSSFRFGSSGSRASGLRAPLRDVHNTCTNNRSTVNVDFGQFAYVPRIQKTAVSSGICRGPK